MTTENHDANANEFKNKIEELNAFWTDITRDNVDRMSNVYNQWAKLEKKSIVQASNNVDEMAKLMKASIDFMTEMNDQWRSLTIDTFRKAQR